MADRPINPRRVALRECARPPRPPLLPRHPMLQALPLPYPHLVCVLSIALLLLCVRTMLRRRQHRCCNDAAKSTSSANGEQRTAAAAPPAAQSGPSATHEAAVESAETRNAFLLALGQCFGQMQKN